MARKGEFNGVIGFTSNEVKGFIATKNEMGITQDAFFVKKRRAGDIKTYLPLKKLGPSVTPLAITIRLRLMATSSKLKMYFSLQAIIL